MKKLLSIFFLFVSVTIFAQTKFDAKALLQPRTGKQQLVNDFAGILTADQQQALENKLVAFDDSTSTQIAVVIVPNLDGYDVADYNVQLGRAWGVGGKEFNNGVVLLISKEDRKLNIATGYGVEGALPDVTCKHIIDEVIVPNFKGNDFYGGINQGTDAIIRAVKGEYAAPEGYHRSKGISPFKIILIIIIILVLLSSVGGGSGGSFMSRRGYRGFNGPVFFPGGWGGGGSSSGGSSGGFGGFGGGSFGGGGASGNW
ncbi:TPM domain-containing protein [Ferruginibacter lapsinanis]|uniref:TPM domain-containing protein n=1 Tax=Ferruginibacter lapsinanis TaxID=563172 RepID=UPI001E2E6D80|nr:TPM domain-containing protein [Ferruginibacter lapsinanis]UEG51262.1 TPM domain-containing protein [Ferruginibacter lapsinanis]